MSTVSLVVALSCIAAPVEMPRVVDDRLQLELILQEPDIVTPVGLTIDAKGRVLVIESHTHFRPDGYQGPPHDRILLIDPTKKPYKPTVFFEGTKFTMNLATAPDGSIYVATRAEIFRLRDTDGDDKADERTPIAHLETPGNYPHNGLSGLAFTRATKIDYSTLYFGFGENLGAEYKIVGRDGTTLVGGGEGGNIYACKPDGSGLRRVATGFWNPFGMTFNEFGYLFAVDNDPDSRPPCRLLNVVEGGDYGFKFRHGRKGTHPFTSWNGELPGTLPMVCGTGEAPSAIVNYTYRHDNFPSDYYGSLLVTSWGDHRIERYDLGPQQAEIIREGKRFTATMKPVVVGGENFRPVGMAIAPDGAVYFSDWIDRSYPLHGKGRVWKLSAKTSSSPEQALKREKRDAWSNELSLRVCGETRLGFAFSDMRRGKPYFNWANNANAFACQCLSHSHASILRGQEFDTESADAYLRQFAPDRNSEATIWLAVAARDANAENAKIFAPLLLKHASPRVRLLGVIWAGDGAMTNLRGDIEQSLSKPGLTRELFAASLAALEMFDAAAGIKPGPRDPKQEINTEFYILKMLNDERAAADVRRFALKALRPDHPALNDALLNKLATGDDTQMRIEAIRTLRERWGDDRNAVLRRIAADEKLSPHERAEAIVGLSVEAVDDKALIELLARASEPLVSQSAARLLAITSPTGPIELSEVWMVRIPRIGDDGGDDDAGERLFFHPRVASCYKCHQYEGRGASIGPDLTTIGRSASRERILQSILDPNREIAPHYVPWNITTVDGLTLTGLYVGEEVDGTQRYADAQGKIHRIHPRDIEAREAAKQSIMPADLGRTLTDAELRDLAAFLTKK